MKWLAPFLVLLVLACTNSEGDVSNKAIFRYNESSGITSLDPAFARMQTNIWACNHLFDRLVHLNQQLQPEPALALSWSIQDSGKTYIFQLRKGVFFHTDSCFGTSGTREFVASDVVYSFQRLRNPSLASPGNWVMQPVDSIWALGTDSLVITLNQPFSPFLGMLSMAYCSVVPHEAITKYGSEFSRHPVGTGPFALRIWRENEKMVLRKNPKYFLVDSAGTQLPYLDAVSIGFIPDKQAAFLEFLQGKVDFISGLDASYKDELLTREGKLRAEYENLVMDRQPYLNTEYLGILSDSSNPLAGPTLSPKLREALDCGINKSEMMRYLRNNIGKPAWNGIVPPSLLKNQDVAVGYHPERAKSIVDSLLKMGPLQPITLHTNPAYLDLCEYVQRQWQQLGVPVKVEVSPPSTLRQAMATAKVGLFRASWIADYPDAENYLALFYSGYRAPNGPNYTQFENSYYDQLYLRLRATTHLDSREKIIKEMLQLLELEHPAIPLFYDEVIRFYRPEWTGLEGNALNLLDLRKVKKEN